MSFMDGGVVDGSFVVDSTPTLTKRSYDTFKLMGDGIIFDKLWVRTGSIEPASFSSFQEYSPTYDNNTLLLADFNNDLLAGNTTIEISEVEGWKIYRRSLPEASYELMAELPSTAKSYIDSFVVNDQEYIYRVLPLLQGGAADALLTNPIVAKYTDVFIIDKSTAESYSLKYDVIESTITTVDDVTEHKTFNQFNTFMFGEKHYKKGAVSAVPLNTSENGDVYQNPNIISNLEQLITNRNHKILKLDKNVLEVITHNFQKTPVNHALDIYSISFSWEQVR